MAHTNPSTHGRHIKPEEGTSYGAEAGQNLWKNFYQQGTGLL